MASVRGNLELGRAAQMFKALADVPRLRLLALLAEHEHTVSELAASENEKITTVSARLQVLANAGLVSRRRSGQSIHYGLADRHVLNLVENALDHASRADCDHLSLWSNAVSNHTHLSPSEHPHQHGKDCGHTAVRHGDHIDYLHDGHLHHPEGDGTDEHVIEVSAANPDHCTPENGHEGHEAGHIHGPGCGHEAVPHGDHMDYLVNGRLHHQHGDHCDDHGPLEVVGS